MSEESTPLHLPPHFPYPIQITKLSVGAGADVTRGSRLLEYSFTSATNRKQLDEARRKGQKSTIKENDMVGSWECSVEGTLDRWAAAAEIGAVIDARAARDPIVWVQQPCTHPVQLHGMCGICGKELAENDYLAPPVEETEAGPSRFPGSYEMGHDALGVTVSHAEAERLDDQGRTSLLAARKLSLIVDLDQTIIHTTVDPTVGEWIQEINAEHNIGAEANNPNEEALKDVASFQLEDDIPPGWARHAKAPDRTYYTKPRPGLKKFMEEMSRIYEMHVYTMGTRTYADAIVKAVDPAGKYFGGRILSRDESGSLNAKSLQRLFPTDQSMVVIIDDRSDVWSDVPNLVKVVPYEFFLGAGDINSSFLPPVKDGSRKTSTPSGTADPASPPPVDGITPEDSLARKAEMLDKLSEERPLQKLQEEMDKETEEGTGHGEGEGTNVESEVKSADGGPAEPVVEKNGHEAAAAQAESTTPPSSPPPKRRPLLKAEDGELPRIASILQEVHRKFYASYDAWDRNEDEEMPDDCDAPYIITEMKSQVLEGCAIVFSGLIPLHQRPETSYHWKLAESFGALPSNVITRQTTHCIAATPGTTKVYQATKSGLHVVYPKWLDKSAALWRRQSEAEYAMVETLGGVANGRVEAAAPAKTETKEEAPAPVESTSTKEDASMGQETDADVEDQTGEATPDPLEGAAGDDDDWDKWMRDELGDEWEDGASERGSQRTSVSPTPSTPDTPRKRVRYADDEDLPLASFRNPPSRHNSGDSPDEDDSPPRKRRTPILLGPPEGNASANSIELSDKAKAKLAAQIEAADAEVEDTGGEVDEEEDEFAQLLAASMQE